MWGKPSKDGTLGVPSFTTHVDEGDLLKRRRKRPGKGQERDVIEAKRGKRSGEGENNGELL